MANKNNHFDLTLDTLAPTGSIKRPYKEGTTEYEYVNANHELVHTVGDASYVYLWFDTKSKGSADDKPETPTNIQSVNWNTQFTTDGTYFYHMILIDDVGNKSEVYDTLGLMYDTKKPTVDNATIYAEASETARTDLTNSLTNYVKVTASDAAPSSGVEKYIISGTALEQTYTVDATSEFIEINFKSSTADGPVTINVVAVDSAGNQSVAETATITLDRSAATAILILKDTDEANLGEWTNSVDFIATIDIEQDPSDVVGYKIWGDIQNHESEPGTWTSVTKGTDPIDVTGLKFTATNAEKTVHIKVIDESGNVWPNDSTGAAEAAKATAKVKLDTQAPAATLAVTVASEKKNYISDVAGYDTATVTATVVNTTPTGATAVSDINTYKLELLAAGETEWVEIQTTASATKPETYSITSADGLAEGSNKIRLTVTDVAGNSVTSNEVTVSYDKTKPTFAVADLSRDTYGEWFNATPTADITASSDTGSGIKQYHAWTSTSASETTIPAGAEVTVYTGVTQTIEAITDDTSKQGQKYLYIAAEDYVGNVTIVKKAYKFDNIAPSNLTVAFGQTVYNTKNATITITTNEAGSGNGWYLITGGVDEASTTEWKQFGTGVETVTLSSSGSSGAAYEGERTVTVKVRDLAGNESTTSASATTELDLTAPAMTVYKKVAGSAEDKPATSNVATFDVWLEITQDTEEQDLQIRVYGTNFTGGHADYIDFEETGKTAGGNPYMVITGLAAIADGPVVINAAVRDNASHEQILTNAQEWTYDNSAPDVYVSGVDFNRISKVHELRQGSTAYADECHFTFYIATEDTGTATSERYQAFKVCAYADKAAAQAGTHEDNPIPTTAGSINMEQHGLDATSSVHAVIKGADYETALGGAGHDGLHYVVVYMQDIGGTWSGSALCELTNDDHTTVAHVGNAAETDHSTTIS